MKVNKRALGSVAGIVGAGGSAGAVAAGFLFRSESLTSADALFYMGAGVMLCSVLVVVVRFSPAHQKRENRSFHEALAQRAGETGS